MTERDPAGVGYMLASAFFFSLMSLQVKLLERLPVSEIVLARAVVSLAITAVALRRAGISPRGRRPGLLILRGLLGFTALCCFFGAIAELDLTDATVLHYLNPILTAVLAAAILGEGLERRHGVALLISFSGVVLVARPEALFATGSASTTGVLLGLGGAVFSAGAYTAVRALRDEHPLVVVLYFPLVTVPFALPWAAVEWITPRGVEWLLLLGVGVTTQVAQIALTRGLRLWPAGPAMNIAYTQIAFAAILQAIVFGVFPHWLGLLGGALIFIGTLVVTVRRRRGRPDR